MQGLSVLYFLAALLSILAALLYLFRQETVWKFEQFFYDLQGVQAERQGC
jgi:hypothetical protein